MANRKSRGPVNERGETLAPLTAAQRDALLTRTAKANPDRLHPSAVRFLPCPQHPDADHYETAEGVRQCDTCRKPLDMRDQFSALTARSAEQAAELRRTNDAFASRPLSQENRGTHQGNFNGPNFTCTECPGHEQPDGSTTHHVPMAGREPRCVRELQAATETMDRASDALATVSAERDRMRRLYEAATTINDLFSADVRNLHAIVLYLLNSADDLDEDFRAALVRAIEFSTVGNPPRSGELAGWIYDPVTARPRVLASLSTSELLAHLESLRNGAKVSL